MKLTIHDDPEQLEQRIRALQKLKTMKVKVGLPASAGDRLRFILAVQEHGSPMMRIPARPVIWPVCRMMTLSAVVRARSLYWNEEGGSVGTAGAVVGAGVTSELPITRAKPPWTQPSWPL